MKDLVKALDFDDLTLKYLVHKLLIVAFSIAL